MSSITSLDKMRIATSIPCSLKSVDRSYAGNVSLFTYERIRRAAIALGLQPPPAPKLAEKKAA